MTVTAMPKNEAEEATEAPPPRSRRKLVMVLGIVVVLLAAVWFVGVKPRLSDPAQKPAGVLALNEQTINLAGGHYLKIQISLQLTKKAKEDLDGSKAQDKIISLFSGKDVGQLNSAKVRTALKQQLVEELTHAYDGEVMDVYLIEFVTT